MTDKEKLITQWHDASAKVDKIDADLREAKADLHRILREIHGVPVGTAWLLRIRKTMFRTTEEYDAVLDDIKGVTPYSRPENKPWATAFRIKKDGTPEDRPRSVYTDWEVIGPYEVSK